nr:hypothetical protein [Candidatus Sigynarchaeota archaeon]
MQKSQGMQEDRNPDGSQSLTKDELWQKVGFHKALGGWWYGLVFLIVNMFTGIFITASMIGYFYPYPSSGAYVSTVNTLFALLFFTFDIATAGVMGRFIPEARIKDPVRMLYYVRFFVWYQMISGLLQVTIIAVYCFYFATSTGLIYLIWIMLVESTKQYPGMLGVFNNLLNTFQYFGRSKIIDFTQGELIERLTELFFVWLGMVLGQQNPTVGALMGIALGQCIGKYIDDFIGMAIGAYYFRDVAKKEGFTLRECFIPVVPWSVVKPVIVFGIKTSIPGFTGNAVSLYVFTLYLNNVFQWILFGAFAGMAGSITSDIHYANLNVGALFNESYMNGKKRLAQTILMKTYRFAAQVIGFYYSVFIMVIAILPDAFKGFNLIYYYPCLIYIVPVLIRTTVDIALGQAGSILYATGKPNIILLYAYIGQATDVLYHTVLILFLRVQDMPGGIFFLVVFAGSLKGWIFSITQHIYIHYRIFKIRIAWWQTVAVPIMTCLILLGVTMPSYFFVYLPIKAQFNFYIAVVFLIIIMMVAALFGYYPITALLGGWDDSSIAEFSNVVKISGPSKGIVRPMFALIKKVSKISPLHNRFRLDDEAAYRESQELDKLKEENKSKLIDTL